MDNLSNNSRNKVNFAWVLITLIVTISMAYAGSANAKSVMQYNKELELKNAQRSLDFPTLEHWDAGNGENAVWVNPRQPVSIANMPRVRIDTPEYKINLNVNQPTTIRTHHQRVYRSIAKIKLFSWDD